LAGTEASGARSPLVPQEFSKKERREIAREHARAMRIEQQKRRRRNRVLTQGGVVLGVLAVVAVVALVIVQGTGSAQAATPANMASDGVVLTGDGTSITAVATGSTPAGETPVATDTSGMTSALHVVTYVDYLCPYCGQFETTNGATLDEWVTSGAASLEVHPIAILDSASAGSQYSTRAANAAACVAAEQPDAFSAFNAALFAQQPAEGTEGLTDDELVSIAADSGADSATVASCITEHDYADWVSVATDRATDEAIPNSDLTDGITGTPTVLVNGVQYTGALDDAQAFTDFLNEQAALVDGTSE
jgi:protein-disulfide isomerase